MQRQEWNRGKEGVIIIDGAWKSNNFNAGAAWCVYKNGVHWKENFAIGFRATNALYAETKACYHVIIWAKHQGWKYVSVLIDCQQLIQNLESDYSLDHNIDTLIRYIKYFASLFNSCMVYKVERRVVCNAHNVRVAIIHLYSSIFYYCYCYSYCSLLLFLAHGP